jgi:O-antigen/teichoic acid export membrane protein
MRTSSRQVLPLRRLWALALDKRHKLLTLTNLSVAQVATVLLSLVSSSLWARNVPSEVYGHYQVILSLLALVSSFCLPGLAQSLTISAAKHYDGNLSRILKLRLGATFLGSLALVGVGIFYSASQPELASAIFVVALLFSLYDLQGVWGAWLSGRGELNRRAAFTVISSVLHVVALAVLVFSNRTTLNQLLTLIFGVRAFFSLGIVISILRSRTNKLEHSEPIEYGFHTTAATLLSGLITTDKLIIYGHLTSTAVAVYSIALIFPTQIKYLYAIFNQMITPNVYKAASVADAWKYLKGKLAILVPLFILVGLVGFIGIPIFVPLLFSERYAAAVPYGKWLWLSLAITGPATYLGDVLRAQMRVAFVYSVSLAHPVLSVILYLILIRYGITGVVLSKIIMNWVGAIFRVLSFLYYLNRS